MKPKTQKQLMSDWKRRHKWPETAVIMVGPEANALYGDDEPTKGTVAPSNKDGREMRLRVHGKASLKARE